MSRLVCLLKGCAITYVKGGFVICPDCEEPYCWDRNFSPRWYNDDWRSWSQWDLTAIVKQRSYPFEKWVPCTHGSSCKNRRLHKDHHDTFRRAALNKLKDVRCERLKLFSRGDDLQPKGS